jgi:copper(I)-binding protein
LKLSRGSFVVALLLAGCGQPKQAAVEDAWVRLAAAPGRPASAYFTLEGGPRDAVLISVTSPVAIKSEMHETTKNGTMSSMAPVRQIALPARGEIAFAPGGKHVMLFDMNPRIKPGSTVPLLFTFADSLRVRIDTKAIAAGDPPPK